MKKIIIYSEIDWNFLDQRHHHLARFFAKLDYEVEFVERVYSRLPTISFFIKFLYKKLLKKDDKFIKPLPKNITLRKSLFLPDISIIFSVYNYALWFFVERYKQKDALIYSFVDNTFVIGKRLNKFSLFNKSVFDIIHNWWEFPWHNKEHIKSVNFCIKFFDLIVTDSISISKKLSKFTHKLHLMLPGVTENWFQYRCEPYSDSVKPVFFGNLRSNSDLELIDFISSNFSIDIYGIIDPAIEKKVKDYPYKGKIDSKLLPKIISKYNCIILPYSDDNFSLSISPAKFFESMATGALIISRANFSNLPGYDKFCLRIADKLGPAIYDDIIERMESQSIIKNDQVNEAKYHTWTSRFNELKLFLNI
ncbi:hypothetical protein [Acinetobacter sp.]|uniref:hypothetical protein n=1 Tax=Acinetobacter sp. TaxID=472 RepID=UPI000C52ADE5|nr:hypothetical protein [Acinetobacter sp.]MBC69405.1 hypothetical protein [Acinetobacter sp.]